jgi:hypothetical protein
VQRTMNASYSAVVKCSVEDRLGEISKLWREMKKEKNSELYIRINKIKMVPNIHK